MGTLSIVDLILMFLGFVNATWIAVLYISLSAERETKISKKIRATNGKKR